MRAPCLWLAPSRCFAVSAPSLEEQCQCHRGGGDPRAPILVSQREGEAGGGPAAALRAQVT